MLSLGCDGIILYSYSFCVYSSESNSPGGQPDPGVAAANSQITDSDFRFFVALAKESELEEVLTTYTHKNKSASVFLGASKPKSSR